MNSIDGKFLMITANIGSLFEEHGNELQDNWLASFHQLISSHKPLFIGVHFQEVGGKADSQSKDEIASFFQRLCEFSCADYHCTCYVDKESNDNAKYTALGCSYLIHKSLKDVEQWNFNNNCFDPVSISPHLQWITEDTGTIEKMKFPMYCFSKKIKRRPRKGFTWTRWKFQNKVFDILNIHLTHDACNITCTLKSPTKYSKHRRRAMNYILERISGSESDHQILFGDFNVRLDTKALVEHLMHNIAKQHLVADNEGKPFCLIYKSLNGSSLDLLKIESRIFQLENYEAFNHERVPDLIKFDKELQWLKEEHGYREMPVNFQPTYPHKENDKYMGTSFSNVRCPSWCDRILVDSHLFGEATQSSPGPIYDSFGLDVCLGDHKPVFLAFSYPGLSSDLEGD